MTDVMEETTAEVARLSRVSVLCGGTQVDVSLPLLTPTEVLIPELVRLFGDRIGGSAESAWSRPWRLAPVGDEPLPGPQTPADAGITDGALLVLFVAEAPPPPPVFDDVFDRTAADLVAGRRWDERSAMIVGLVVLGLATVASGAVALRLGLAPRGADGARPAVDHVFAQLWCGAAALALLTGSLLSARRMAAPGPVPTALAMCATVLAGVTGALVVPLGADGRYGPPHALLATATAAVAALVALRFTGRGTVVHTALLCGAALAGPAMFAALWLPGRRAAIAATVAIAAYLVLVFAARIAAVAARLPLPHVPAAGERIDPIDDDPPPTVAGVGAVASGLDEAPQERDVPPRSDLAQLICTGITVGAAAGAVATLAVGAAARELPGHHLAFALVMAVAFCLRGRTHAEPVQAGAGVLAGAVIAIGTATGLAWGFGSWPVVGLVGLATVGVLALACGVLAPGVVFSPVQRRLAELGEYLTIAAAGPLLGWVWDVYATVRNL
ncbi:type VII secretion integral membrane protein EccD [Tsukamurella paurometabola]|uniref:Type VII secretion integral membrane protein EccD n=1 Tax=Tsukamurella paurometabola TaxID=2061 RepID=A0ABS5NJ46_TSUPA|nr:type VII secretion integral membrane protein EccD [Tsukamurella paurometabola]MBS4103872.1 type VII secretion integral membrane protein EccD [Tsukamurella paurometabola]